MPSREEQIVAKLRQFCADMPEAEEGTLVHHVCWRRKGKPFVVVGDHGGLNLSVKVGKEMQGVYLEDTRFYKTPYMGHHGWVSFKAADGKMPWPELKGLVVQSYELVAVTKKARKTTIK